MTETLTRRDFLRTTTTMVVGMTTGGMLLRSARAAALTSGESQPLYVFPVLGDIHYDLMSHHDMSWVEREKPKDIRQIKGYVEASEKYTPLLMDRVGKMIQEAKSPVPFVVQLGDFVEGLCGSRELQSLQFRDAISLVEKSSLGAPFLVTKGNHDITGPGAKEAYNDVMLPWLSKQTGQELKSASFVVTHDKDLFIFFDTFEGDLNWLEQTLKSRPARHVFFILHYPVVPYNARSNWCIYSREQQRTERNRLLTLLGRYKVIVLSAHLHKYGLLTRQTHAGPFVHVGHHCAIIRSEQVTPEQVIDGVENYGPDLVNLEPNFSPDTLELRRRILAEEAPYVNYFEYADFPGYSMIKVYPDCVEFEILVGLIVKPWRMRDLIQVRSAQARQVEVKKAS
jgi:3',5'-cyclic AMP phosphodiesterase CpdA